jgi:chemotaxis protein MotB
MDDSLDYTAGPPPQGKGWMIVFTDLVSLMLTFFVLLFSMSSVQVNRWEEMIDALSQTLAPSREKTVSEVSAQYNIATIFRKRAINLDYLAAVLKESMAKDAVLARCHIMRLEDRMVIALPGDLLFATGEAALSDRARRALFTLGGVLRNVGNQIGVNGHTDPVPPRSVDFTSNWELSLARAVAVANALRRSGYREDVIAYGFADSQFDELPVLPLEERRALGRRVDIVVMPTVDE